MKQRVITGTLFALALCAVLLLRKYLLLPVLAAASVICCHEFLDAFAAKEIRPIKWICYFSAAITPALGFFIPAQFVLVCALLPVFAVLLRHLFRKEPNLPEMLAALCAAGYAAVPFALLVSLLQIAPETRSGLLIACAFLFAYFGDMAAYFTGVAVGRHKMTPILSPKKTWEGAAGGLAGSMLLGALLYAAERQIGMTMPLWPYLALGLVCGVAEQAGDLTASLIKRFCGVKDYGKIFPGHGGMMDRVDSVLFTTVVIYGYCLVCGLL